MTDAFDRAVHRTAADEVATGFRIHLGVYLAVNVFLVAVWALASGTDSHPWFVYPLGGWGIGVVAHYLAVRGGRRPPP